MKTWNNPSVEELEVKLTASSGLPADEEQAGFLQNGWNDPTYNQNIYKKVEGEDCVWPIDRPIPEDKSSLAS